MSQLKDNLLDDKPIDHDPTWAGVRLHDRKFRDVIFAGLFVVNMVAVLAVSFWAITHGDYTSTATNGSPCFLATDSSDYFSKAIAFLENHTGLLWVSGGIALAFGIFWTVLLRAFTKIAIYVTLAAAVGTVIAGGIYLVSLDSFDINVGGYILFGVAAILVCIIIWLRKKIALTAAVMSEACKGLQHNPMTFIVAFVVIGLICCFIAMWVASLIFLNCVPTDASNPHKTRYLFLFLIFGGAWTILFLIAALHCSIAGAMSVWYFSRQQGGYINERPSSPALTALGWAFSTSFGSLAAGSLILALIAFVRYLLYRAEKASKGNKVASCIFGCLQCCCSCLFGIVKALNDFAYIYIAMYGTSFTDSARQVFSLIGRNPLSAIVVESLANMVLWFGRILGTVLAVLAVSSLIQHGDDALFNQDGWSATSWVLVLTALIAFAILSVFSNVITCAVDTVFVCYCEDMERNRETESYCIDQDLHQQFQSAAKQAQGPKTATA